MSKANLATHPGRTFLNFGGIRNRVGRLPIAVALGCSLFGSALFLPAQDEPLVGYGVLSPAPANRLPVGAALFRADNGAGELIWEAGVGAVEPTPAGRIFVDEAGGTLTAIALANPSPASVTFNLTLRDQAGQVIATTQRTLGAGSHVALFVFQLFPDLPAEFLGSLTFETLGGGNVSAVTLRQNTNRDGEPIFATLPVVDLSASGIAVATRPSGAPGAASIVFPQVGAGEGLATQLVLINPTAAAISGTIRFFDDNGQPLNLEADGEEGSVFQYNLPGDAVLRRQFSRSGGTAVGYGVVTPASGQPLPAGSAIFRFRDPATGAALSEAGVEAVQPTTALRIFVDNLATQTGLAVASRDASPVQLKIRLLTASGGELATTTRDLAGLGHLAIFADQLFPEFGAGFTGQLEVTSPQPVAATTLKLSINGRGDPILTTLPVADSTGEVETSGEDFPQVGFGATFATRLILLNPDLTTGVGGSLHLHQSSGEDLEVALDGESASEFPYAIAAGGSRSFNPIERSGIARILLEADNPTSEIPVNQGGAVQLSPVALDQEGQIVPDVQFQFLSLNPDVATAKANGEVSGLSPGFATLAVSAGGVVETGTISVTGSATTGAGLSIEGVAPALGGRLYLANTPNHALLTASGVGQPTELFAGANQSAGLVNGPRAQARFRSPSYLALNQAVGELLVADRDNNVIRAVDVGAGGLARTLAGTGQSGATDGPAAQARFNRPQGVALDPTGRLWVADTGNHTVRRIDLAAAGVTTVAGLADVPGLSDGVGGSARFRSPVGIALEPEPLAEQLARELRGDPPPPVRMIVVDRDNGVLRRVWEDGTVETLQSAAAPQSVGPQGSAPLTFNRPTGVAVDGSGTIYVAETGAGRVRAVLPTLEVVTVAQTGTFSQPLAIVIPPSGGLIVGDSDLGAVSVGLGQQPTIQSISPDTIGVAGERVVTIRGVNFTRETKVVVGSVPITQIQVPDRSTITFTVPPLAAGRAVVRVETRYGVDETGLTVAEGCVDTVVFADASLEAGVRNALGIGPRAPVTCEAALELEFLSLNRQGIEDLTGFEAFPNLIVLSLFGNGISDLSPLSDLTNLTSLTLGNNSVSDLAPLSSLVNLTSLHVGGNEISDISPLANLRRLNFLVLGFNSVNDLAPLAGLTSLGNLSLNDNSITNLGPLAGLNRLETIDLSQNLVSDLTPLAGLTSLRLMTADGNSITDAGPLADLAQLMFLSLADNLISNVAPLANLTGLQSLTLSSNQISDIGAFLGNQAFRPNSLNLPGNLLDQGDCPDIQALRERGVLVDVGFACP